jgi:hypothetical protein
VVDCEVEISLDDDYIFYDLVDMPNDALVELETPS